MSKRRIAVGVTLLGVAAAGAFSFAGASSADIAPQPKDVVGVGSDVVQNSVDFLSDSSPFGDPGYNSIGNLYRVFDFDASPDANGRAAFVDPSLASGALTGATTDGTKTTGTGVPLRASSVLAAGESPQERPNGGGAGVAALTVDTSDNIDFVRSPNLPTGAQEQTAQSNLKTSIHAIQFADDSQYIATAKTTNAPAGLTAETLAAIYCKNYSGTAYQGQVTTWKQITGNSAGSSATIDPERPQDGAGVLTPFQNALAPFTSDKCAAWNSDVAQVQQNDPTTVQGNPDAIVVFPLSRFKLLAAKYYPDTANAQWTAKNGFPANDATGKSTIPLSADGITLQIPTGKPGAGLAGTTAVTAGYYADLPFYILFRDSDATSTSPWQPGSTLNWAQTLFYNADYNPTDPDPSGPPAPFFASAAAQTLLTNLGLTPKYVDEGSTFQ